MPQYISPLLSSNEFIIDDSNYTRVAPPEDVIIDGEKKSRGRVPRDWTRLPYGAVSKKFPFPLIARGEWAERIKDRERQNLLMSTKILTSYGTSNPIMSLDQDGTNYCWYNGVVSGVQGWRFVNGLPHITLSSASGAARIKNGRNEGGWGGEAAQHMHDNGVNTIEEWGGSNNSRDMSLDTAASREKASHRKLIDFCEIDMRNFAQKMTALLLGFPIPSGYNWWSHEICAFDPVVIGVDAFGSRERNSWGESYGEKGFLILAEGKSTPDDGVVILSMSPFTS